MPGDQGGQTISIIFHASAQSSIVNRRHKDTRMLGIYKGGYITLVPPSDVSLSALVCEISDGTHQVRVETTDAVSLAVAKTTKEYVVLRWIYTGVAADDYMAILAVASPLTNDIVVGKCSFTVPGVLQGFDYSERSDPDIQHLFLRVEPTGDTELRVRIRGGRIQTNSGVVDIADQKSDLFTPPTSNSRVYLVYVTAAGAVAIDSSGAEAADPVAPTYKGKLVLAEVTVTAGDDIVTADQIRDVRNFITTAIVPDDVYITKAADGKLTAARDFRDYILIRDIKAAGVDGGTFTSGAWRTRDLTEESSDVGGHAGLGANRITLAAGTYEFEVTAPAGLVGSHQVRLYNISDASIVTSGSVMYNGVACVTRSEACGRFTITSPKVFEVQHRCSSTQATTGFGKACNFGSWEQYTIAKFWKVA
jgi:hypothetical protein